MKPHVHPQEKQKQQKQVDTPQGETWKKITTEDETELKTQQKFFRLFFLKLFFCMFAASVGRQVFASPEQRDSPRPHHQVSASPAQEEETSQHQCAVPGQCCCCPLLGGAENYKIDLDGREYYFELKL